MLKRQPLNYRNLKRQHRSMMSLMIVASTVASSGISICANAATNSNLDYVLTELSRQHNNASDLIKSARQPNTSLALSSQLLNQTAKPASTDNDVLGRLSAVASTTVNRFSQSGVASWYGRQFHGKKTASGEVFDQNGLTAAHRSLPLNCYVKVTNKSNGKSVVVKVNDRGPFSSNRVMDLSYGAAKQIGLVNAGSGNVVIERVANPN